MELKENEILVLRDVRGDMRSKNNFVWPEAGPVEAPDWMADYKCGHGLHGLPWGMGGDYRISDERHGQKYLVVKVSTDKDNYRSGNGDLTDKCKFKRGEVVYCGNLREAVDLIAAHAPPNTLINWSMQFSENRATQTAGDYSTQTAGDYSTQTAGYRSTQTAGDYSTQTAGNWSTQTAEDMSTQTAGHGSTQTAEDMSTQTAGDRSTQTAGYESTQTAGDWSTQTAEDMSTQTAGDWSTQTAGDRSTQTAGEGTVQIGRWVEDGKWKTACRILGPEEAGKPYRFSAGKWEEVV